MVVSSSTGTSSAGRGDLVRQSGHVHAHADSFAGSSTTTGFSARFAAVAHHPRRCPTICGCDRSAARNAAHRGADREDRAPGGGRALRLRHRAERFDHVVVATHSDQALGVLSDPSRRACDPRRLRYQPNTAVLHTDERMLPPLRRAWASWNYTIDRGRRSRRRDLPHESASEHPLAPRDLPHPDRVDEIAPDLRSSQRSPLTPGL